MSKKEIKEKATNKNYRTWVYKLVEGGLIDSKIVGATEAEEAYEQGWRLSPVDCHEVLSQIPRADQMVQDVCFINNFLLNIKEIDSKDSLMDFGNNFLGLNLKRNNSIKNMKYKIIEACKEKGMLDENGDVIDVDNKDQISLTELKGKV